MQAVPNKKKYINSEGSETAYYFVEHEGGGISDSILIFMHGYTSDCTSTKAKAAFGKAIAKKIDGVAFDFFGHGDSSGTREDFTPLDLYNQALEFISNVVIKERGYQSLYIVGFSVGGFIASLFARDTGNLKNYIKGFYFISPSFDWPLNKLPQLSMDQLLELKGKGKVDVNLDPENTPVKEAVYMTEEMIKSTEKIRIFGGKKFEIFCPVFFVWGLSDRISDPAGFDKFKALLTGDVDGLLRIFWIPTGDHFLKREQDVHIVGIGYDDLLKNCS